MGKRDVDYVVKDGEVVIIDSFTGRMKPGQRYSEGLHQALEAKERVKIVQETQTGATISYQYYFRKYKKLAGMTGTAATEANEFAQIYNLDVVVVPTNMPLIRQDLADQIYKKRRKKKKKKKKKKGKKKKKKKGKKKKKKGDRRRKKK